MKLFLSLLILVSSISAQSVFRVEAVEKDVIKEGAHLKPSSPTPKIDSLTLSINTYPVAANVAINNHEVQYHTTMRLNVIYQNHFKLELYQDQFEPYSVVLHGPIGSYGIECEMVPKFEITAMQKEIDKRLYNRYRDPTVLGSFIASLATYTTNSILDSKWESYAYHRQYGYELQVNKDQLESISRYSKALTYVPLVISVPVLSNWRIDRDKKYSHERAYHFYTLDNKTKRRNAALNSIASILGGLILDNAYEVAKTRENSAAWNSEMARFSYADNLKFSSRALLLTGIVEFVDWLFLVRGEPKFTDFISISTL